MHPFRLWLFLFFLFTAVELQAITWEFEEEGDVQGWTAREGTNLTKRAPLRSEVVDGIWRIFPAPFEAGRNPSLELVSPLINRDSALFDRVIIRFRVVHTRPFITGLALRWTNPLNRSFPGGEPEIRRGSPPRFELGTPLAITTEWQEAVVGDLREGAVHDFYGSSQEISWEGELFDFRIGMGLAALLSGQETIQYPEEMVEAVEIDRIVLTGAEEQMQGELSPPVISSAPFGELFAPPFFSSLGQRGIGGTGYFQIPGELGDVDGDGDIDLVALWSDDQFDQARTVTLNGWLEAFNDGMGGFGRPHSTRLSQGFMAVLYGADLDHDGRMELLVGSGSEVQLLSRDQEEGWQMRREFNGWWLLGLADADGDGHADIWMLDFAQEEDQVLVFLNDGNGQFEPMRRLVLGLPEPGLSPFGLVELGTRPHWGMLWAPPYDDPGQGYEMTYWNEDGEEVREHLATEIPVLMIRYAGDFDQDGDVDLMVSSERIMDDHPRYRGLSFLLNRGDGVMETMPWDTEVELLHMVRFFDLNQDGALDLVAMDGNIRHPAILVGLGVPHGLPILEGRYPLNGRGGAVLGGDVDQDGDVDLVVLETAGFESGGVHVLLNRWGEQVTVAGGEEEKRPSRFYLAPNYPNPFNPQTWIPFEIPEESGAVDLRIYNVLGQPIRTLVAGRLAPGHHLVLWDGRDSQGQAVSAGVYLYRLHASDRQIIRKMLKIE